jgi:hypothetical protein
MLKTLIVLGGLSLLLCATPLKATTTAGELAQECSHRTGDPESLYCIGFLKGWGDQLASTPTTINGKAAYVGFKDQVSIGQVQRVFVKYVKNHPEIENHSAITVLLEACFDAKIMEYKNL